ncbi:MAG TPA: RagB/SusD family nutrient uptake outer membrane protein [Puia sp.]|nr:RagB/SusD family nutrient uptake outer membrane protein [Puia sp.]
MKKNKNKYIALLSLPVLMLIIFSCKKFLSKPVVGSLSPAVLANKAGVDGLLIGAYSMLDGYAQTSTSWETSTTNWIYGGVAADDAYKGSNTTDQPVAVPIENHSVTSANEYLQEKWAFCYNAVQRANDVIRELPLVTDGSVTADYAAEVTAEARFLRGVFELEAAKMWRNVPYVNETIDYANGNYNVGNPGPIWDSIENDFTAAMAVLPKGKQTQPGRANYYAAEAFLAKAYMFDHKYSQALPLLTDLINNGVTSSGNKYALGPFEDNFDAAHRNNNESVFCVQMTVNDGSGGQNSDQGDVLNYAAGTYTGCCGFYQPSYSLGNAYKVDANGLPMLGTTTASVTVYNSDNTTTSTVSATLPNYDLVNLKNDHGLTGTDAFTPPTDALDPRIDWTLGRRGIPYLDWGLCGGEQWSRGDIVPYNPIKNVFWHYNMASTTETGQGWAGSQANGINYNLIRFADVILWRAECEVEGGDLQSAEDDVNMVRNRMAAHPEYWVHTYVDNSDPSKGFTNTPAANYKIGLYGAAGGHPATGFAANGQDYARSAVYMERQLELAMEGHRFFDLQRYDGRFGGPMPAGYMAGVLNNYILADTRISNPVLNGHKFTSTLNEIYPIPIVEIDKEGGALVQNTGY